jgi:SRSO17 transposase
VPEEVAFKTKVELASEMIDNVAKAGIFKAKWVGADSFFGRNKDFLKKLPEGMLYFADILFNMKVFPLAGPAGSGIAASESIMASEVAADENISWVRIILAEGAKGPIIAEEKCIRVFDNDSTHGKAKGVPGEELWLYIRRYADGKLKYALSDAPLDTPITELRRAATMRWPIEQCFEECKDDL